MEALAAFAVACNVLQVIGSSVKAIELCKQVHEHGSSVDNQDLEQRSSLIAENSRILQESQRDLATATTRIESQLYAVADKCLAITNDLQIELAKLKVGTTDDKTVTLKKYLKTLWHQKNIEKIEQEMERCQSILQTSVLAHMNREQAVFILDQHDAFSRLEETLRTFIQRFADGYTSLSDLVSEEENQTRLQILQSSRQVKDHFDGRFEGLRNDSANESRRQRLLNSLKFPEMNIRRNDIEDVHEGTFNFAFEENTEEQNPWSSLPGFLRSEDKLYWIQGKPGSGKSTLMKLINEDCRTGEALAQWRPARQILRLSFFFWLASSNPLQRSSKGLWCSLLYQLLSEDLHLNEQLRDQGYKLDQKDDVGDWSSKELSKTFLTAVKIRASPTFILLDGLDEFDQEEGATEIVKHVKTLSSIPELKVLISSRPEFEIELELEAAFPSLPKMKLQDLTRSDITKYVEDYLQEAMEKSQLKRLEQKQVTDLVDMVVQKADGVFIWVRYVLRSLIYGAKRCSSWEELQNHLQRCPSEIHNLYNETWRRQNSDEELYRKEAALYFHMVINPPRGARYAREYGTCSVFDLMVAKNQDVQERVLDKEEDVPLSELVGLCKDTVARIKSRSAGLLEISRLRSYGTKPESEQTDHRELLSAGSQSVGFIHRSAFDFLANTPEGQEILSFYRPTPVQSCISNVRLDMVVLLVLGSDRMTNFWDIFDDVYLIARAYHDLAVSDDNIVAYMQIIIRSYYRAIWPDKKSDAFARWNFHLPAPLSRSWAARIVKDAVGLAAYLGVGAFVEAFAKQSGLSGKLKASYVDYLLCCVLSGYGKSFNERRKIDLVKWLLDQKANPNQRQYIGFGGHDTWIDKVLITPLSLIMNSLIPDFWSSSVLTYDQWDPILHHLLGYGADFRETMIITLERSGKLRTLQSYLERLEMEEDEAKYNAIFLELEFASVLQIFGWDRHSTCPTGLAYTPRDDTRHIRFVKWRGKFYQPNDKEPDLVVSASGRYMKAMQDFLRIHSEEKYWHLNSMNERAAQLQWDEHIAEILDEVLPRCKEITRSDMRSWFIDNGWFAPEGYVPPFDVDYPFESVEAR